MHQTQAPNFMNEIPSDLKPQHSGNGWFQHVTLVPGHLGKKTKLNGEALVLSKIINSMHLIDIYGSFHWNSENSPSQRTSSKIHHILGYKENLSKYRKIEIASSILSDHNRIKMAINNRNYENIQTHRN